MLEAKRHGHSPKWSRQSQALGCGRGRWPGWQPWPTTRWASPLLSVSCCLPGLHWPKAQRTGRWGLGGIQEVGIIPDVCIWLGFVLFCFVLSDL